MDRKMDEVVKKFYKPVEDGPCEDMTLTECHARAGLLKCIDCAAEQVLINVSFCTNTRCPLWSYREGIFEPKPSDKQLPLFERRQDEMDNKAT